MRQSLQGAIKEGFEEEFGWALEPGELSPEEQELTCELLWEKYRSDDWNDRC